jgi:hypothetical protein
VVQVVIDYPTPAALSQFITKQLLSSSAAGAPHVAAAAHAAPATQATIPIQISSQLAAAMPAVPGSLVVLATAARSPVPSTFIAHDPVGLVPLQRWDIEADATTSSFARWVHLASMIGQALSMRHLARQAVLGPIFRWRQKVFVYGSPQWRLLVLFWCHVQVWCVLA